jgi:hypothetical protein
VSISVTLLLQRGISRVAHRGPQFAQDFEGAIPHLLAIVKGLLAFAGVVTCMDGDRPPAVLREGHANHGQRGRWVQRRWVQRRVSVQVGSAEVGPAGMVARGFSRR